MHSLQTYLLTFLPVYLLSCTPQFHCKSLFDNNKCHSNLFYDGFWWRRVQLMLPTVQYGTSEIITSTVTNTLMDSKFRPGVLLQVGQLAETFLTVGAAVRFDTQMYA